jgi:hypothetical protein
MHLQEELDEIMHAGLIPSSRKAGWLLQAAQRKKKKNFSSISTLAAEDELLTMDDDEEIWDSCIL